MDGTEDLLVASNRLPIEVERTQKGLRISASSGGLASALHGCMTRRGGAWIGWPGLAGAVDLEAEELDVPYGIVPVALSEQEIHDYYEGFANEILWPLFHDLHEYCEFEPRFWRAYRTVNRRFAEAAGEHGAEDALVWVHDYHLVLMGAQMREAGDTRPLGFFLHTPFPPSETLERLPWHRSLLEGLTAYDLVGLQTRRDVANLRDAAISLIDGVEVRATDGRLFLQDEERADDEATEVAFFPISIDTESLQAQAEEPAIGQRAAAIRRGLHGEDHVYIVGVERLDYTKGILERLGAFEQAIERFEELRGSLTLVQHINPSREGIPQYEELRSEIDGTVGRINAEHGTLDWQPIRYTYGHLAFEEILALYRAADVALVTSLMDGMNLVAKEYCAANIDEDGVLVLSKFAGAAEELCDNALVVNPHDVERTAEILYEACTMAPEERRRRMRNLRAHIAEHDVHRWAQDFLHCLDPSTQLGPADPARSADVGFPSSLRRVREER